MWITLDLYNRACFASIFCNILVKKNVKCLCVPRVTSSARTQTGNIFQFVIWCALCYYWCDSWELTSTLLMVNAGANLVGFYSAMKYCVKCVTVSDHSTFFDFVDTPAIILRNICSRMWQSSVKFQNIHEVKLFLRPLLLTWINFYPSLGT